jgi:hypothetical protein
MGRKYHCTLFLLVIFCVDCYNLKYKRHRYIPSINSKCQMISHHNLCAATLEPPGSTSEKVIKSISLTFLSDMTA